MTSSKIQKDTFSKKKKKNVQFYFKKKKISKWGSNPRSSHYKGYVIITAILPTELIFDTI